uniref:MULE transposase domain-containing protein n=1 Tax=Moniliophthora roreri TaxID=221103 RepID=A0A0W0ETV3_MONRR
MPQEAAEIIRENLLDSTPGSLVYGLQKLFPQLTAAQIHSAWTIMSEEIWKKHKLQLPSAQALLEEYSNIIDIFPVLEDDGVEQLCWGMKKIADFINIKLKMVVVEVSMDVTYDTNAHHLELSSIMAEIDGTGFLLFYCLLSTVNASEVGKKIKALWQWATHVKERYHINSEFIHVDKDMAEIGMVH